MRGTIYVSRGAEYTQVGFNDVTFNGFRQMKTLKTEHDSKLRALNVQLYDTISEKDEIFKKVRAYESVEWVLRVFIIKMLTVQRTAGGGEKRD